MAFDDWDEVRTAYQVARLGTVSGAAGALGVHHATVIRHIDSLEGKLGTKLFQRHARGYTPTEAGQDLLKVAGRTDDQLSQLANRIRGRGNEVTGDLIITSIAVLAPLLSPALAAFQEEHPEVSIQFLTDERLFRLEYGEAHVAIRAGSPPDQPDNVVQKFYLQGFGLYASKGYIDRMGRPESLTEPAHHRFIGSAEATPRAPFFRWMNEAIPRENITYRVNQITAARPAVLAGLGIGFSTTWAEADCAEVEQVFAPRPEWNSQLWLVTHVDLHRTAKVQTFVSFIKDWARDWPVPEA
jgi:DNA-binding transcriptional LysR family regulator